MATYSESWPSADTSDITTGQDLTWYDPLPRWWVDTNRADTRTNNLERRGVADVVVGNNQYSQAVLSGQVDSATTQYGVIVRSTKTATNTCYAAFYTNAAIYMFKVSAGTYTNLGSYSTGSQSGGTIRLEVIGTSLKTYWNGVERISNTDAVISSGYPGIYGVSAADSMGYLDSIECGDLSTGIVHLLEGGMLRGGFQSMSGGL